MPSTLPTWQSNGQFNPERYVPVQYSDDAFKGIQENFWKMANTALEQDKLNELARSHDLSYDANMARTNVYAKQLDLAVQKHNEELQDQKEKADAAMFKQRVNSSVANGVGEEGKKAVMDALINSEPIFNPQNNRYIADIYSSMLGGKDYTYDPLQRVNPAYLNPKEVKNYKDIYINVNQAYKKLGVADYVDNLNRYGKGQEEIIDNFMKLMKFEDKNDYQSFRDDYNSNVRALIAKGFSPEVAAFATLRGVDNGLAKWTKDFDFDETLTEARRMQKAKDLVPEYTKFLSSGALLEKHAPTYQAEIQQQNARKQATLQEIEKLPISPLEKAKLRVQLPQLQNKSINNINELLSQAMVQVHASALNPRLNTGYRVEGDRLIAPPPPKEEDIPPTPSEVLRKQLYSIDKQWEQGKASFDEPPSYATMEIIKKAAKDSTKK